MLRRKMVKALVAKFNFPLAGVLLGSIAAKILKAGYLMNFLLIGRIALDLMEKIGRLEFLPVLASPISFVRPSISAILGAK